MKYQIKQVNFTPEKIEKNLAYVASMNPVKTLTGNEFIVGGTDLSENVSAYFTQLGGSVYNEELGDIELSKRGVKDSLGHGMGPNKAAAFAAVKEVLENGKVIDFENRWKGRDYDTAVVAAPITIKGENYYMGVVVRRSNVQRYYLHEVLLKKQSEIDNRSTEAFGQTSESSYGGSNLTINSVLEKLNSVNTENSDSVKAEKFLNQQGIELLNDDTATMQYGFKTYTKNERAKMLDALVEAGFERESAEKWLKDLDSVSAKIGADPEQLDFTAADNHTMLKKNSEYRYTVDASTLRKKRLLYQGTFNAIPPQRSCLSRQASINSPAISPRDSPSPSGVRPT